MTASPLPNGTRFIVTETIACHHADLAITNLGEITNSGPMLVRFVANPARMQYSVTDLNRQFVSVLIATGKAQVIGYKKPTRRVAKISVF